MGTRRPGGAIGVYTVLAGAMDSSTGLLLMAVPATTLGWMGIRDIPAELAYVRFIGAFVAAVGSIYFLPFVYGIRFEDVLTVTALVRIVVGAFVGVAVVWGALETAWASVAVTDLILAAVQIAWLARWRHGRG